MSEFDHEEPDPRMGYYLEPVTERFDKYAATSGQIVSFFLVAAGLAILGDELRSQLTTDSAMSQRVTLHLGNSFIERLSREDQFLIESMFIRAVDNFLNYLNDVAVLLFTRCPEMLKSASERLDFVLQYRDMFELREALANKRASELSRKSLKDMAKDLAQHIQLFEDEALLALLSSKVEIRNLIVHNRSTIDHVYARKTSFPKERIGAKLTFGLTDVFQLIWLLNRAAVALDRRVAEKFAPPLVRISTETLIYFESVIHFVEDGKRENTELDEFNA